MSLYDYHHFLLSISIQFWNVSHYPHITYSLSTFKIMPPDQASLPFASRKPAIPPTLSVFLTYLTDPQPFSSPLVTSLPFPPPKRVSQMISQSKKKNPYISFFVKIHFAITPLTNFIAQLICISSSYTVRHITSFYYCPTFPR